MFPTQVEGKGARPVSPYMLLVVGGDCGFGFGTELLNYEPTLEAMGELFSLTVVYKLASFGIVPRQIKVRSVLLFQLQQPLAEEPEFDVKLTPAMPAPDRAKEFVTQRFF